MSLVIHFIYAYFRAGIVPARLGREAEAATKEQSTYLAYDKRVKELAEDVTSYQVRQTYTEEERLQCNDPGSTC